jgi:Ca2+-transporting ATPase
MIPDVRFEGLSGKEARELLLVHGPNEIRPRAVHERLHELKRLMLDPMGLMLLSLAVLNHLLGRRRDAILLLCAWVPVVAVDVLLLIRAGRVNRALQSEISSWAKVLRDGKVVRIRSREVVPGDLLLFEPGESLPADGEVLEGNELSLNEALLTGESLPVEKNPGNPFYAGTRVLSGGGTGRIIRTGQQTRFGGISSLLSEEHPLDTPLQIRVRRITTRIFVLAMGLSLFLFLLEKSREKGTLPSLVSALTFAMSAIPEEFPLVFTLYLSLGAIRLSRAGVWVKSLPAVETLGSVTVIGVDKTGTLTEGRLRFAGFEAGGEMQEPHEADLVLRLSCSPRPVDSLDLVLKEGIASEVPEGISHRLSRVFDSKTRVAAEVWSVEGDEDLIVMKGAIEEILKRVSLSQTDADRVRLRVEQLAATGERILGLASKRVRFTPEEDQGKAGFRFHGLLRFYDPVRKEAQEAIRSCREAGIELRILTGDHPGTARAVAESLGLHPGESGVVTGNELEGASPEMKSRLYRERRIFARVSPEQKYEWVKQMKADSEVVAMTGDGVNDAPALRTADIGISTGIDSSEVARTASRMVLTRNNLQGIVNAVYEGRRIADALEQSFSYLVSFHVPVMGLAFLPPFLGWGDFLLPVHIVLLELLVHPISAFAFEGKTANRIGVRRQGLGWRVLFPSLLKGVLITGVALAWYTVLIRSGEAEAVARAAGFAAVLGGNLGLVFSRRASIPRMILIPAVLIALALGLFTLTGVSQSLHFEGPGGIRGMSAFLTGCLSALPGVRWRASGSRNQQPG